MLYIERLFQMVYIAIDHKTWKAFALKIMVRLIKVSHGV